MYDAETIKPEIVRRIAKGEFVREVALSEGMPAESTINGWLAIDDEFRRQCAAAREASADVFEGRVVELADQVVSGAIDPKAGAVALNALTWVCKVRNRKVYGDKVEVDARVSSGGAILERLARARDRVIDGAVVVPMLIEQSETESGEGSNDSSEREQREARAA